MVEEEKQLEETGKAWGRKAQLAIWTFGAPFVAGTVALFLGKMDAGQWTTLIMFLTPMVLGIYNFSNVGQKFIEAKWQQK